MIHGRNLVLGLLALAFLTTCGCGSKGSAKPTVKGRVEYRGEPLNGGAIVFVPDAERGHDGPLVKGSIQPDGTFTLDSANTAGIAPGWYRVAVAAQPASTVPSPSDPYPGPSARYRNPQLSGLAGEVKPGVENAFEFQIDD